MTNEGQALLLHLREVLKDRVGEKSNPGGLGVSTHIENESIPNAEIDLDYAEGHVGGKHGLSLKFRRYLDSIIKSEKWEDICARSLCASCKQPPAQPMVTSCYHIYCATCLDDLQHMAARRGRDAARCAECGESYTSTAPCEGLDTFQAPRTSTSTSDPGSKKKSNKDSSKQLPSWISMPGDIVASSKTQACKAQILNWLEEKPNEKIIIFTQFIPMVTILGRMCKSEKWPFLEYTGKMSHEAREKAITEFGSNKEKKILLAGLKCGGLGLNLTMASRVSDLCLDPFTLSVQS